MTEPEREWQCPNPDRCDRDRKLLCSLIAHLRDRVSDLEAENLIDPLTRVGNRRAFDRDLAAAVGYAARHRGDLSLALLDLDHFKAFNDRHGHPAGDVALTTVASALSSGRRKSDRLARIGGEEFALILPGTPVASAARVSDRLREAVHRLGVGLTVSIGCVGWRTGVSADELVRSADEALYIAKAGGRDRVIAVVA